MEDIKGFFIKLLVIIAIIVIPVSLLATLTEWFVNAIKWIVFIDNAKTGLPQWAEVLTKGIVEGLVVLIFGYIGFKEKHLIVIITSITLGFVTCFIIFWISKYIIWILAVLLTMVISFIVYLIIKKNMNKNKFIEGDVVND